MRPIPVRRSALAVTLQGILIEKLAAPKIGSVHRGQARLVAYGIPVRANRRDLVVHDLAGLLIGQLKARRGSPAAGRADPDRQWPWQGWPRGRSATAGKCRRPASGRGGLDR